ncbi:Uncharacterized protein ACMD2_15877 [Ananas comosus]|uniref:Uncharacterized protein n=1 Tax=Ananas comosus TaxID=4615 RepID=A0A199V5H6_ANACO|nr:Uncharacterized protein ACMD2_15877 [Ananas comosus]
MNEELRARPIQKAKIEILLEKTNNFDELMAAAVDERDAADARTILQEGFPTELRSGAPPGFSSKAKWALAWCCSILNLQSGVDQEKIVES